jgi:hypothetical protein
MSPHFPYLPEDLWEIWFLAETNDGFSREQSSAETNDGSQKQTTAEKMKSDRLLMKRKVYLLTTHGFQSSFRRNKRRLLIRRKVPQKQTTAGRNKRRLAETNDGRKNEKWSPSYETQSLFTNLPSIPKFIPQKQTTASYKKKSPAETNDGLQKQTTAQKKKSDRLLMKHKVYLLTTHGFQNSFGRNKRRLLARTKFRRNKRRLLKADKSHRNKRPLQKQTTAKEKCPKPVTGKTNPRLG